MCRNAAAHAYRNAFPDRSREAAAHWSGNESESTDARSCASSGGHGRGPAMLTTMPDSTIRRMQARDLDDVVRLFALPDGNARDRASDPGCADYAAAFAELEHDPDSGLWVAEVGD